MSQSRKAGEAQQRSNLHDAKGKRNLAAQGEVREVEKLFNTSREALSNGTRTGANGYVSFGVERANIEWRRLRRELPRGSLYSWWLRGSRMQSNAATFSYHQREIVGAGRTAYAGREERFLIIVPRKCNTVDQSFRRSWDVCKRFKEGTKRWGWDALVVMRGLERSWGDTTQSS